MMQALFDAVRSMHRKKARAESNRRHYCENCVLLVCEGYLRAVLIKQEYGNQIRDFFAIGKIELTGGGESENEHERKRFDSRRPGGNRRRHDAHAERLRDRSAQS